MTGNRISGSTGEWMNDDVLPGPERRAIAAYDLEAAANEIQTFGMKPASAVRAYAVHRTTGEVEIFDQEGRQAGIPNRTFTITPHD